MFSDDEMRNIQKLLAAILHIGNLRFQGERKHAHTTALVVSFQLQLTKNKMFVKVIFKFPRN